jgi:aerotaxis receptor
LFIKPSPRNQESPFKNDEFFFSITDERGVIEAGNDVFTRISGYAIEEMIGNPHSIVRHPDMPRVVFKLLWGTIKQRQPIVAYVKNMAQDGSYYWVLASVFPIGKRYASIRIKPTHAGLQKS